MHNNKHQRSIGVVVVDDNNLLSSRSSCCNHSTPFFYCLWRAADISPTAGITSKSVEGTNMATFGIDVGQLDRFAEPIRADAVGIMVASAADATEVEPPAVAAEELTH